MAVVDPGASMVVIDAFKRRRASVRVDLELKLEWCRCCRATSGEARVVVVFIGGLWGGWRRRRVGGRCEGRHHRGVKIGGGDDDELLVPDLLVVHVGVVESDGG